MLLEDGGGDESRLPSMVIVPESKVVLPLITFNKDVLPLPDGPIIHKTWEGAAHPETPFKIILEVVIVVGGLLLLLNLFVFPASLSG